MTASGSVSAWISQLHAGQETALGKLHERYWPWLVGVARQKMKGARLRAADEEDVAQQAFWSFYRRFRAGGVPRLSSRQDLFALLTTIAACKAVNQIQHEAGVQKRGAGQVQGESALHGEDGFGGIELVAGPGRTPQGEAILRDNYRYFVEDLPEKLRPFAELYLAGCTHREIAEQLGCVERTVERKLALILDRWQEMAVSSVNAAAECQLEARFVDKEKRS